jgi:hypothetical protein
MGAERVNKLVKQLMRQPKHPIANIACALEVLEAMDRYRTLFPQSLSTDSKASQFVGAHHDPRMAASWATRTREEKEEKEEEKEEKEAEVAALGAGTPQRFDDTDIEPIHHYWRAIIPRYNEIAIQFEKAMPCSIPAFSHLFVLPFLMGRAEFPRRLRGPKTETIESSWNGSQRPVVGTWSREQLSVIVSTSQGLAACAPATIASRSMASSSDHYSGRRRWSPATRV